MGVGSWETKGSAWGANGVSSNTVSAHYLSYFGFCFLLFYIFSSIFSCLIRPFLRLLLLTLVFFPISASTSSYENRILK